MKKLSFKSRFSHGILLLILLVGAVSSAFAMHNIVLQMGGTLTFIPILLMLVAIGAGVMLYQKAASYYRQYNKKEEELDNLRKSAEQTRQAQEEEIAKKSKQTQQIVTVDFDAEAKSVIPSETIENTEQFIENLLANIANKFEIVQGLVFLLNPEKEKFAFSGGYAYFSDELPREFIEGETLSGQVAKNKVLLNLDNVPDGYITILSGLGKGTPKNLIIAPILTNQSECVGVIELASFKTFTKNDEEVFRQLGKSLGEHFENETQSNEE